MKRSHLLHVLLIAALAVIVVLLGPGTARAAITYTYPSAACLQVNGLDDCINNTASPGDTVKIKAGTYHETGTNINQAVTVTGPLTGSTCKDPGAAVIDAQQSGDGFYVDANGVTIKCLTVEHAGVGGGNYGIEVNGALNLHVQNVVIVDSYNGIYAYGGTDGLQVTGSTINGTNNNGIQISNPNDAVLLSGNRIRNTGSTCVYFGGPTTNANVSKNDIGPCGSDGIYIDAGNTNSMTKNSVHTTADDAFEIYSSNTTISANTINGSEGTAIYVEGNTQTITKNIFTGTFDSTVIEAACCYSGLNISGNTLLTGGSDFIDAYYDNATITNNTAYGKVSTGILVAGTCCYDPVANPVVTGNRLLGGVTSDGIELHGTNPMVKKNTIASADEYGLYIRCTGSCSTGVISGNSVKSVFDSGYCYDINSSADGLMVSGNSADECRYNGFYFTGFKMTITNNTATQSGYTDGNSGYGGFRFENNGSNTISGNKAIDNGGHGFWFNDGGSDTISSNTAKGNALHGFEIHAGDNSTLNLNTSKKNYGDGFNNDALLTNFTNNKASGNLTDCSNDAGEGATTGTLLGNSCADGFYFTTDSTLTDQ